MQRRTFSLHQDKNDGKDKEEYASKFDSLLGSQTTDNLS